jgi:aspartate-semialdehyde dehydrogenase
MSVKKINVAVAGATGAVGNQMLTCLQERNFPIKKIKLLASSRSAGRELDFMGKSIAVEELTENSFKGMDIALFSAGGGTSKEFAPVAARDGCVVVDNSSAWRMDPEVPLVVPEVNPHAIAQYKKKGIIANPNCSTIQMVVPLNPLHKTFGIKRVVVSTYQSVSGTGQKAIEELDHQTRAILNFKDHEKKVYPHTIAFNCLPHIDVFLENGYTKEEMKMVNETIKIFEDLEQTPGVKVVDDPANNIYPLPINAAGQDLTLVGRIRNDESISNGINMWVVADNIRKGAATNTVQIAELLVKEYL